MSPAALATRAARVAARTGGALILASALLVAAEVAARNLGLGLRLHAFELTNYAFAIAVAFGFAHALTTRSHIRIDLAYRPLPAPVQAVLDLAALAATVAVASGMAWHGWRVVRASLDLGARPNSTLDLPLALPQAIWAAGLTFFALVAAVLCLATAARLARGRIAGVRALAGAGDAEDER